jgi:hypothetical protein
MIVQVTETGSGWRACRVKDGATVVTADTFEQLTRQLGERGGYTIASVTRLSGR